MMLRDLYPFLVSFSLILSQVLCQDNGNFGSAHMIPGIKQRLTKLPHRRTSTTTVKPNSFMDGFTETDSMDSIAMRNLEDSSTVSGIATTVGSNVINPVTTSQAIQTTTKLPEIPTSATTDQSVTEITTAVDTSTSTLSTASSSNASISVGTIKATTDEPDTSGNKPASPTYSNHPLLALLPTNIGLVDLIMGFPTPGIGLATTFSQLLDEEDDEQDENGLMNDDDHEDEDQEANDKDSNNEASPWKVCRRLCKLLKMKERPCSRKCAVTLKRWIIIRNLKA